MRHDYFQKKKFDFIWAISRNFASSSFLIGDFTRPTGVAKPHMETVYYLLERYPTYNKFAFKSAINKKWLFYSMKY